MRLFLMLVFSLSLLLPSSSFADEFAEKARNILKQHEKAVVLVKAVIKSSMSFGGQAARQRETKRDMVGTVIDSSGLTIVSLSKIDPGALLSGSEDQGFNMKTELASVKIVRENGKEVSAKVILRDKDLDLAFVLPEKKQETSFDAISLENTTSVQIMDQVLSIARLGKIAKEVSMVEVFRINAIVKRPRTFYVAESISYVGAPVFSLENKLVGFTLTRIDTSSAESVMSGDAIYMVLPVNEMEEVIKQAKEVMVKELQEVPVEKEAPEESEKKE